MSAAVLTAPARPRSAGTLRELAVADARRYARHPVFLLGLVLTLGLNGLWLATAREPDPSASMILPAFFIGVFGFVVGHRLATSLRRTDELVGALPSTQRRRTLSLCLACVVPFLGGCLCLVESLVVTAAFPPVPVPADAPMLWFGQAAWLDVMAALMVGTVACLGGPLLGVVVGTWAPFRGSALLGVVLLLLVCTFALDAPLPWRVMPPFAALVDEQAVHGDVVSSTLAPGVSPPWYLVYVVLLCALGVVVALLRDREGRRPLLWTAAALAVAAAGALALTVS
jgi:hypothetical protein